MRAGLNAFWAERPAHSADVMHVEARLAASPSRSVSGLP